MKKLTSRKFWITVAAILASIGTAIAGLNCDNEIVIAVGIICAVFSGAIYNICEALVDANATYEGDIEEADIVIEDNDEDDGVEVAG